jgi:hypothetical protein
MPLNFAFNAAQIIWMVTFAAQLVLLVVLLGRDRAKLFPIFALCTILATFRWLASRLLFQRMSPVAGNVVFLSLAVIVALANLGLLVELAIKAFKKASVKSRAIGAAVVVVLAGALVILWGPWPGWKMLTGGGLMVDLRLMQLVAQRCDMLTGALSIQVAILVAFVGRRLGAGWRSHTQLLLVGLGTIGACQLAISATWQTIVTHTVLHSQEEYFHMLGLRAKLNNANSVVYILVLIWWIGCLWIDEPTTAPPEVAEVAAIEPPAVPES